MFCNLDTLYVFTMIIFKKKEYKILRKKNSLKEQIINIQAEAYYRAMRKYDAKEQKKEIKLMEQSEIGLKDEKWFKKLLFMLNVIFFPWKPHKSFTINNQIYDSILVLFVSLILGLIGTILWLIGLLGAGYAVLLLCRGVAFGGFIGMFAIGFVVLMFGSIFILAASEFSKVLDSNRIYAYSACIIALISCVVAVLTLLNDLIK